MAGDRAGSFEPVLVPKRAGRIAGGRAEFDTLMGWVAERFARVEPRRTARAYVVGLLSGVERKNCWWLAEHAGLAGPQSMQRLVRSARWDADEVRDEVRRYVVDRIGGGDGVLIADETGFLKKGSCSAGVQRQYTGTADRIENAQVGVLLSYTSARGRALIDRRLPGRERPGRRRERARRPPQRNRLRTARPRPRLRPRAEPPGRDHP